MALNPSVENISKQYVFNLIKNLNVASETVTIINPPQPIDPTSSVDLWHKLDALPPPAVYGVLSDTKGFFDEYAAILNNLQPQIDESALKSILTDDNQRWVTFQINNPGSTKYKNILEKFDAFADSIGLDPSKVTKAKVVLKKLGEDPLTKALDAINEDISPQNFLNGRPIYIPDIDTLKSVIRSAPSLSFSFDSSEFQSSNDNFWSSSFYSGGIFDWFSSGSNVSSQALQSIHNAKINVTVTFDNFARFTIERGGWYMSSMMTLAYQTSDNTVWGHESPSWNNEFGPNGSFTSIANNIIVVDGIHISASFSNINLSSQDASSVQTATKQGFWPFFGGSDSKSGWTHDMVNNNASGFTLTSTCVKGNPQYLALIQEPAKVAFGSGK